jgi:hypothetical protein
LNKVSEKTISAIRNSRRCAIMYIMGRFLIRMQDLSDLEKYSNDLQLRQTETQSVIDEFAEARGKKEAVLNAKNAWNKELKE